MEKSKTSRKFLATALVAILVISTISMAIPVLARNSGVRDYDVTAKRILPILFDAAGDGVDGYCDDDILDVYDVTDDGTNLYFMVELGCIPADTWLYLDMDVDQNISTGYNTNTDIEDGYLSSHDTGIDYTIEVPDGVTEYWALIVGVADYVGTLSDLNYADDDAIDMYNTLLSDYYWQADHIQLLIDGGANKSDIQNAFNWLDANEDPDDVVLFFFSGHGTHGPDIAPIDEADGMDEYICPHDFNNIRDDELAAELDRLGSTSIVVIIDACFSGGMAKASDHSVKTLSKPRVRIADGFARDIASPRGGQIRKTDIGNTGRVVLMGCDDYELSSEISELENGLFSYYVIEGLKGNADRGGNGDGNCSAEETFEYANVTVIAYLEQEQYLQFPKQHPQIYDGYIGEIPITQVALVANFTGTPTSGPASLTVEFTDTSTSYDGITSWAWDFGDGATSTDQNPRHEYTTERTYNVSLTVGEEDGKNDTETKENYITVTSDQLPVYNVSMTSDPIEQTTSPDEEANYTLTITNNGNVKDTIELNITVNEANYSLLSADNFSLNASETVTVSLNVRDPDLGIYHTTARATSQGNTSVFGEVTVKTNVSTVGRAPTADYLEIEDACGESGTYVVVPVSISNVKNGPVQGIRLTVDYNESVLNLTEISSGDLTSNWGILQLGEDRHKVTLATFNTEDAIPDGSSGSVVLLNFSVIGSSGDTSPMDLSLVELSDTEGTVGTAPAKNGVFTVSHLGTITGRITYACNGTGIADVVVNLTKEGTVVYTTVTNETGYYTSTDVIPDCYFVNVSKPRFYDNSTEVTVTAGETTIVAMMLWLKGDLNNNGVIADAGDVVRMLRASVGDIPGDVRYDLNANGVSADAGDVVLLLRASVGDIELL